jgi:hypothetical protein
MITAHETNFRRFCDFNDGLLQKIRIEYSVTGQRDLIVVLNSRDWDDPQGGWPIVTLTLLDVREYRLVEPEKTNAQVISAGIHLLRLESGIGIDFGGLANPPTNLSELRESNMYVVATSLDWKIAT